MTRRTLRLTSAIVVAIGLAVVLVGCGAGESDATADTRSAELVLDWFPNADHAGLYMAMADGNLEAEGVALDPQVPSDPAAALKQVGTGRAPFAISYEPEVLLARSQGIPVVAVAALVSHPLNSLIVRSDSGVERPRDLEGHTVGISGLPSDRPLLDTVVAADGGDPAKVRTRSVGYNLSPALAAERVDALVGAYWNIEAPELEARDVPVDVFRLEEYGVPDYDELVLVTSDEMVREDPELIRSVVSGLAVGTAAAAADPRAAAEAVAEANPDLDADLLVAQVELTAPLLDPEDEAPLALDPDQWREYADWMREEGLLEDPVDVDRAVSTQFLPAQPEGE